MTVKPTKTSFARPLHVLDVSVSIVDPRLPNSDYAAFLDVPPVLPSRASKEVSFTLSTGFDTLLTRINRVNPNRTSLQCTNRLKIALARVLPYGNLTLS